MQTRSFERDRAKEVRERPRWKKPSKPKAEPQKPKTWTKKGVFQQAAAADDAEDVEPVEPGRESDDDTQSGEEDEE